MPSRRGYLLRPLLDLPRGDTEAVCRVLGLPVWHDPHNRDDGYARARVRRAMPLLTAELGSGLVGNLARTASLVADDNEALEAMAAELLAAAQADEGLRVAALMSVAKALRTRVLRRWMLAEGARAEDLSSAHIAAVEALVVDWRGQRPTQVPGGLSVARSDGLLVVSPTG